MANRVLTNGKAKLLTDTSGIGGNVLNAITYAVLDTNNSTTINNYTSLDSAVANIVSLWQTAGSVSSNQWMTTSSTSAPISAGSTIRSLLVCFTHLSASLVSEAIPLVCIDTNAALPFATNGGTVTVSWSTDRIMTL